MIIIIKFILPKYHNLIDINKNIDLYWLCNTSVTPMTPIIKDKLLEKVTERLIEYFKEYTITLIDPILGIYDIEKLKHFNFDNYCYNESNNFNLLDKYAPYGIGRFFINKL